MSAILDWLLICIGAFCAIHSLNAIIKNKNSSLTHFIILVVFITCCLPILCNYCIGIPKYETIYWYQVFCSSMNNGTVAVLYDLYIMAVVLILELYAIYYDKTKSRSLVERSIISQSILQNKVVLLISIFSPIIYIVLSGNLSYFLVYGVRSSRYVDESNIGRITSSLILLSVYAYFFYIFSVAPKRKKKIILSLAYIFVITWLQGKRFILIVIGSIFLFYYTKSGLDSKQQRHLRRTLPLVALGVIIFSCWYLIYIRPMSNSSFDSIYDMLRVDLGRDDVIKYVIEKVIINQEKIVPYSGSTYLSTFLFFIPRAIWATKPYPHYVYLTASILNLSVMDIPAGTTPSWFEMSIANFGGFGFIFGVVSILLLCVAADKLKETAYQLVAVLLICALLTQNIDAYLTFVLLFVLQYFVRKATAKRTLVILFAGRRLFTLDKYNSEMKKD